MVDLCMFTKNKGSGDVSVDCVKFGYGHIFGVGCYGSQGLGRRDSGLLR